MNQPYLNLAFFALLLIVYLLYLHKPLMNLVNVAKEISDRKKEAPPETETIDIMDDVLVEMDLENLVPIAQEFVANMDPDKNPEEEIMRLMKQKTEEEKLDE